MKRWWVQKYKLPASHDAFTSQTLGDLLLEFYEDAWLELRTIEAHAEKHGNPGQEVMTRWNALRKLLLDAEEDMITGDPLVDKWERELREGKTPNLNEGLP